MLNFVKPTWRNGEKIIFFRSEVLERIVAERGKSPLPADRIRRSIKKFNLGRWQEYNNVAMWTYEVTWSARKKELSQRSSFSRPIFFDIWVLFGSLWADTYLLNPKLVLFSVLVCFPCITYGKSEMAPVDMLILFNLHMVYNLFVALLLFFLPPLCKTSFYSQAPARKLNMFKNFSTPVTLIPYMFTKVMFRILLFFQGRKEKSNSDFSIRRERKGQKVAFS